MKKNPYPNVIAFDDAPFPRDHRGDVKIVGTIYAGPRFDGLLVGKVRKDGANSAKRIVSLVRNSKFNEHIQLVMLQGVSMAGFNVVDTHFIFKELKRPVLVVARRRPEPGKMEKALLGKISGGRKKWSLVERLGPMEPCMNCHIQRVGISKKDAEKVIKCMTLYGNMPEPLRVAHLIAGALATGTSVGRV